MASLDCRKSMKLFSRTGPSAVVAFLIAGAAVWSPHAQAEPTIISPGNSIGELSFPGDLTVAGTLLVEVSGAGAGAIDRINVTGIFDIDQATVDFDVLDALDDEAYVFGTYGTLVGPFSQVVDLPSGYDIDYAYGERNEMALVRQSVPEPTPLSLIALASAALMGVGRRRR
jgi:hypothetical protein